MTASYEGLLCSFLYLYTKPLYLTSLGEAITRLFAISRPVFPAGKRVNFPNKGGGQSILVCKWRTLYFLSCITSTTFKTSCKSGKPTGFVPFFEQKIQGVLKDTFGVFQGLHSMQKKSLESMSFFSSSTSGEFYPEGLCICSFTFTVSLSNEIQGLSSTDCNFQELSRPWIFILKFKGLFQGISRYVRTLGVEKHIQEIQGSSRIPKPPISLL